MNTNEVRLRAAEEVKEVSSNLETYVCLVVIRTDEGERAQMVARSPFSIGRSLDCDIVIAESAASRKHAVIEFNKEKVTVEDQKSANGSALDGMPMQPNMKIAVSPKQWLEFGSSNTKYSFQVIPAPLETATLEKQQAVLRSTMDQVVNTIVDHTRKAKLNQIEAELENYRKTELVRRGEEIQKKVQANVEADMKAWQTAEKERIQNELQTERDVGHAQFAKELADHQQKIATSERELALEIDRKRGENARQLQEASDAAARNARMLTENAEARARELVQTAEAKARDLDNAVELKVRELTESAEIDARNVKAAAEQKASMVTENAEARARELVQSAEHKAQQKIEAAESSAQQTHRLADMKAEELTTSAELKSREILDAAETRAREMTELAESQARELTETAEAKAREVTERTQQEVIQTYQREIMELETLKDMLMDTKQVADSACEDAKIKLHSLNSEKQLLEAQVEGLDNELTSKRTEFKNLEEQAVIAEARAKHAMKDVFDKIQQEQEQNAAKAAQLIKDAHTKANQQLQETKQRAEEIVRQAQIKADDIQYEALQVANEARAKVAKQVEDIVQAAQLDAVKQSQSLIETAEEKIKKDRDAVLKQAQQEAQNIQQEIISKHQLQIKELQNQISVMNGTVQQVESQKQKMKAEMDRLAQQNHQSAEELEVKQKAVLTLSEELRVAEERVREGVLAQAEKAKAMQELHAAKTETERLRSTYNDEQLTLQERNKKLTEDLLLQHEDHKRKLTTELQETRLRAQEELKKQIDAEEARMTELRRQQAAEIARNVQVAMVDRLQAYITNPEHMGEVSQDLFNAVKSSLTDTQVTLKPMTIHLEEARNKKIEAQKKWIKPASIAATAALVLIVGLNHNVLLSYFRSRDTNSIAKQMIEQRKIQSIYQPEQYNEYQKNYTDNVLHMRHYADVKLDPDYSKKWILRLQDLELIKQMDLNEDRMVQFVAIQNSLVQKLTELRTQIDAVYLQEGIERMRTFESSEMALMQEKLKSSENLQKIQRIEQQFFMDYLRANASRYTTGQTATVPSSNY